MDDLQTRPLRQILLFLQNNSLAGLKIINCKASDCILHALLFAKLAAYGFEYNSLQMLQRYTSQTENKKQKLMMRIVSTVKICSELHKALY